MNALPDVSLDRVLGRTRESGDCLEWAGYAVEGKFPQIRVNWKLYPVRRLVWQLVRGPAKPEQWIGTTCENPLCVNPDHLVARTRSKALKGNTHAVMHKLKIAQTRRKGSYVTQEMVREIRSSNETNIALAKRLGMTHDYVSKIRLGKRRADYVTPFQGLGAR